MRKILTTLIVCAAVYTLSAQRAIVIDALPANTPTGATIYFAGSINNWDPGNDNYTFSENEGLLVFDVPENAPNSFEGKITRGGWESVEGNEQGSFIPNRNFSFTNTDTIHIEVLSWEDLGGNPPSDLPDNVITINDNFFMPQLGRNRRVRIYLPHNYDEITAHYPVLYMHDGQNLFSASESFAGEWEVDETLTDFENNGYEGCIVVAIDNGGQYRINEYTPWANAQYGGGDGAAYTEFIVNTLKPYIDENYRTLTGRESTGIMGSSLGGLISHYAALTYPEIFSKAGVLSPSFWFSSTVYDYSYAQPSDNNIKFYFLAGGQESNSLPQEVENMIDTLIAAGHDENFLKYKYVANGQHSEWFWAQEFPEAFEWLFLENAVNVKNENPDSKISVYPNPTSDVLHLSIANDETPDSIHVFDVTGKLVLTFAERRNQINISKLTPGNYLIQIVTKSKIHNFNIVKL